MRRLLIYFVSGASLLLVMAGVILFLSRMAKGSPAKTPDVPLPTIYNGELVLPKVGSPSGENNLTNGVLMGKLAVVSANLAAIFDQNKLTGIRVVGEVTNAGSKFTGVISPIVRFFDANGKLVGQKIARVTAGFEFPNLAPGEVSLYDVTADNPPVSDKLEILFNVTSSSDSAMAKQLKISNRNLETKVANMGGPTETASDSATPSASATQQVDYYIVSGQVVNTESNPISDIVVYAWGKNDENKVFALGHTDFKNDLINPGEKIDFKVMLLPLRSDMTLINYEIAAWGREYKLSF